MKKIIKEKKRILIIVLSYFIIISLLCASNSIVFATCDDTTMVAIASGGYGTPSEYIINMHMIIGYLLKVLFQMTNHVNWITVLYLFVVTLSVLVLGLLFSEMPLDKSKYFLSVMFLDIFYVLGLTHFTFTIVAYWAGISALIVLHHTSFKQNKMLNISGWILLLFAVLIRAEVMYSLIIVYVIVALESAIRLKRFRDTKLTIIVILLVFFSNFSNTLLMNINSVQAKFYNWGETRSKALDCKGIPYDSELLSDYSISYPQYNAIYQAFYYIYDSVSLDVMNNIIEINVPSNKYNFDIIEFVKSHYTKDAIFGNFYRIVFESVFLFSVLINKRKWKLFSGIYLSTVFTEFVFYFINRQIYRVVMPNYMFASLLILYFCDFSELHFCSKQNGIDIDKITLISCFVLSLFSTNIIKSMCQGFSHGGYDVRNREVIKYITSRADNIYLAGDTAVFSLDIADSIWKTTGEYGTWNLIGNWETYSVPYFELMDKNSVKDPYNVLSEAINSDNIYLLTTLGDDFPDSHSWELDLIKQYYGISTEFVKVDDICYTESGRWTVYKIVSSGKD